MIDIVDRLEFDAARCELQFSKGVAGNITEAAAEIKRLRALEPIVWVVKWATKHTPKKASAYLNEADAKRAAANVKMYADASDVVVIPAFAAPSPS